MADIMPKNMTIEKILDHEEKITMGRPVVYYNGKNVEYIDKQGRRQMLWLVIYEYDSESLGACKRWVVYDTGDEQWTGGIIG